MSIPQPLISVLPDRSTRLMLLGVCQILLGGLCGLMAAFMAVVSSLPTMPQAQKGGPPVFAQAVAVYVLLAGAFAWLGIGMISARRWAWTLTVVLSWMGLVFGTLGFIAFVCFIEPRTWAYTTQQSKIAPNIAMAGRIVSDVVVACLYILVPAFFVALGHDGSVRATCARRDPKIPWTDRCPMPVLALALILAVGVLSMGAMGVTRFVVPLFGSFVAGTTGAAVVVLIGIVLAYLAWGTYHLQMTAWWGALLLGIAGSLSSAITFARADLAEMYKQQGFSAEQVEMFKQMGLLQSMPQWGIWMGVIGGVGWTAYLLAARRYFVKHNGLRTPPLV
jgi:hypothetical protein